MNNYFRYGIALLLSYLFAPIRAQSQLTPKTLRFGFYNEAIALPSAKIWKTPIHPTIGIGSDFRTKRGKHFHRSFGADVYLYKHQTLETAAMLDATYQFGYHFKGGLEINLQTSLGYKHALLSGDKYQQNDDGTYEPVKYAGKSMANLKIGTGLAYPISIKYKAFVNYQTMVSGPSGGIFLPVIIQTFLGVGIQMSLSQK